RCEAGAFAHLRSTPQPSRRRRIFSEYHRPLGQVAAGHALGLLALAFQAPFLALVETRAIDFFFHLTADPFAAGDELPPIHAGADHRELCAGLSAELFSGIPVDAEGVRSRRFKPIQPVTDAHQAAFDVLQARRAVALARER